ncbi:hypothetical protein RA29_17785 [Tateyamaria sp. ANG-S1]|nr:hypothetical protein RA29_17785 [Tateyamaria sp. ANG-S1]
MEQVGLSKSIVEIEVLPVLRESAENLSVARKLVRNLITFDTRFSPTTLPNQWQLWVNLRFSALVVVFFKLVSLRIQEQRRSAALLQK